MKHKKNYSISTSCSNTQRAIKDTKFNPKNKTNKKNYLYWPNKNNIGKNINIINQLLCLNIKLN